MQNWILEMLPTRYLCTSPVALAVHVIVIKTRMAVLLTVDLSYVIGDMSHQPKASYYVEALNDI